MRCAIGGPRASSDLMSLCEGWKKYCAAHWRNGLHVHYNVSSSSTKQSPECLQRCGEILETKKYLPHSNLCLAFTSALFGWSAKVDWNPAPPPILSFPPILIGSTPSAGERSDPLAPEFAHEGMSSPRPRLEWIWSKRGFAQQSSSRISGSRVHAPSVNRHL